MSSEVFQQWAGAVESIVTVGAILIGGVWTYKLFIKERQRFPAAKARQEVTIRALSTGQRLLHVRLGIQNTGKVLLNLQWARCRLQQVEPIADHLRAKIESGEDPVLEGDQEVGWPVLNAREWQFEPKQAEIEPGEDEWLDCDFIVEGSVETVVVYGYIRNARKRHRDIGWGTTRIIDVVPTEEGETRDAGEH